MGSIFATRHDLFIKFNFPGTYDQIWMTFMRTLSVLYLALIRKLFAEGRNFYRKAALITSINYLGKNRKKLNSSFKNKTFCVSENLLVGKYKFIIRQI